MLFSLAFVQVPAPFPLAGEAASLAAAFLWAGSISVYRFWGQKVPPQVLNLLKSVVASAFLGLSLLLVRPQPPEDPRTWAALAISGLVGLAAGDTALFAALKRLGAHVTSCIYCLSPPFAALIAVFFLGETLNLREVLGVAITVGSVAGVLYFGKNNGSFPSHSEGKVQLWGVIYALLGSLATAFGVVIARKALQSSHVLWGTFLRMGTASVALAALRGFERSRLPFKTVFSSRRQIFALFMAAFFGTFLGVLLLCVGAKYTKAALASALSATFPLWVIPIARAYLGEKISGPQALCTVSAVLGIFLIMVPPELYKRLALCVNTLLR